MTRSSVDLDEAELASFEELRVRDCSIKRTLDVIGEKWTLLVLREAFYGARRFEQFLRERRLRTDPAQRTTRHARRARRAATRALPRSRAA